MAISTNPSVAGVAVGSGRVFAFDFAVAAGAASATEQILKQIAIPAGLLLSCNYFALDVLWTKSGLVDTTTSRIRLGPLGTVADAAIFTLASPTAAQRSIVSHTKMFASSATNLRVITSTFNAGFEAGNSTTTAYPQNFAVTNLAANNILTVSMNPAGATDIPTVGSFVLTLY